MTGTQELCDRATELKEEGNNYFAKGEPEKAVKSYTEGLKLEPDSYVLFSNRAAAYLKLNNLKNAVGDAKKCVDLAPEWPKGYVRLAQAHYRAGQLDECEKTLATLTKLEPDNRNIKSLSDAVATKRLFQKLKGKWYGRVSPELGGYVQKFDFQTETTVIVSVFGRAIVASLHLDGSHDPAHLDLLVESEPGQPTAPEVKHICKLDENDVLHLCSPYMTLPQIRPTKFEGPAYVTMQRGEPPVDTTSEAQKKSISNKTPVEKCLLFAKDVIALLPKAQVTPTANMSEEEQSKIVLENVKFQTAYFDTKELYGDDIEEMLRLYLEGVVPCPNTELQATVTAMRKQMQAAGLFPTDEQLLEMQQQQQGGMPSAPPTQAAAAPAATPPAAAAPAKTQTPAGETPEEEQPAKIDDKVVKDNSGLVLTLGLLAVAAAAVTVFVLKKNKN